jgi:4-diphosphocytidyl-2-C-methyl-D-erythritol kinase
MRASATRVLAPAKINLHLRVGPPAHDGFHPLCSWMVTVGLFDTLDLEVSPAGDSRPGDFSRLVRLTCDDSAIPTDGSNLIVKAAHAMLAQSAATAPSKPWSLSAALQKRIPVGAGLGGGSSDGAATILALNRLLGLNWPTPRLAEIGAGLGSDVPFFFFGSSSICTGRGEVVTPTPAPKVRHAVLVLPGIHMPTPAVYRRFDEMNLGRVETLTESVDWRGWSTLGATELMSRLVNDLEAPAFAINPQLADLHQRAGQLLGRVVRMSGSGSSLFCLFDSRHEAESAAVTLMDALAVRAIAVDLCPTE